jgi:hypothetical protein
MKRWVYKVVGFSYLSERNMEKSLDELGRVGWELVSMSRREGVMKRPLEEEPR